MRLEKFAVLLIAACTSNVFAIHQCTEPGQTGKPTVFQDRPCSGSLKEVSKSTPLSDRMSANPPQRGIAPAAPQIQTIPPEKATVVVHAAKLAVVDHLTHAANLKNPGFCDPSTKSYSGVAASLMHSWTDSVAPIEVVCGAVNAQNQSGKNIGFVPFFWSSYDNKVVIATDMAADAEASEIIMKKCDRLAKSIKLNT